jgi:integrase
MKAPNTRLAYDADWRELIAWCHKRSDPSPLPPLQLIARYYRACGKRGLKAGTIARKHAAVMQRFQVAGADAATLEQLRQLKRDACHALGRGRGRPTEPLSLEPMLTVLAACPTTLSGLRDAAMLALGWISGLRRGELSALTVTDLRETPTGLRLYLRQRNEWLELRHDDAVQSVARLRAWLRSGHIRSGRIFRQVHNSGRVLQPGITGDTIRLIVRSRAATAGLDPRRYSPDSVAIGRRSTPA